MLKGTLSFLCLLYCMDERAMSHPSSMQCDYACFAKYKPGDEFGQMDVDSFGKPTGNHCVITTNVPASGYISGQAYVVTVTSITPLARKLACNHPGFAEQHVVNSPTRQSTSTHAWTADSNTETTFRAFCGSSDEIWVASPITVNLNAGGNGGGTTNGPTVSAAEDTTTSSVGTTAVGGAPFATFGSDLELMPGLFLKANLMESDAEIEVTMNKNTWIGLGFSAGQSVSMTGDGNGVDLFACSDGAVLRYWMTDKNPPRGGIEVPESSCTFAFGKTTMQFRRPLAAVDPSTPSGGRRLVQAVAITPGTPQTLIYAHGDFGATTMSFHGPFKDGQLVDLQSLSTAEAPKKSGEATLYLHLIFMILSWGMLLPWGVALANRTRDVPGAPSGAWFRLHRSCQIIGLILQCFGFIYALWHCGSNVGAHFQNGHTIIGAIVIILGLQQPLNAAIRPHPPEKDEAKSVGRLAFEMIHKGSGYLAILLAIINIWYGIVLLNDQLYNSAIIAVAVTLALLGILPVFCYVIYSFMSPDNGFSRLATGAGGRESLRLNRNPVVVGNSKSDLSRA